MEPQEFNRQLIELRKIIADGIAYFSAWRSLRVGDEDSAQALNHYRGLFLPAQIALQSQTLMQFAKVFDKHPKAISLRNLLSAANENRLNLIPYATEKELQDIEEKINNSKNLLTRLKRYLKPDLLIIDDFALKEFSKTQAEDLYELIDRRYCSNPMIVTANRSPKDWYPLFPYPVIAQSALDRLISSSHVITLTGKSYRILLRPDKALEKGMVTV